MKNTSAAATATATATKPSPSIRVRTGTTDTVTPHSYQQNHQLQHRMHTTGITGITLTSLANDLARKRKAWRESVCAGEVEGRISLLFASSSLASLKVEKGVGTEDHACVSACRRGRSSSSSSSSSAAAAAAAARVYNDHFTTSSAHQQHQQQQHRNVDRAICLGLGSLSRDVVDLSSSKDEQNGNRYRYKYNIRKGRRMENGENGVGGKAACAAAAAANRRRAMWQLAAFLEIVDFVSSWGRVGRLSDGKPNIKEGMENADAGSKDKLDELNIGTAAQDCEKGKNEEREVEMAKYRYRQKRQSHNKGDTEQQEKNQTNTNGEMKKINGIGRESKISMYAQDPLFTSLDVVFLKSVGIEVIPCEGTEVEVNSKVRDDYGSNICNGTGGVANDNVTTTTATSVHDQRDTDPVKSNVEALEEAIRRFDLGPDTIVDLMYDKDNNNKSEALLNRHIEANTDCITAITPSTFFFAPFLEHDVLLRRILHPHLTTGSYPPQPTSSSSSPTSTSTIPSTTTSAPSLTPSITNHTTQPTPSNSFSSPALYIGTDIAEVVDAFFTRKTHKQETRPGTENSKDDSFTHYVPRRQRRRKQHQQHQQQQQQQQQRESQMHQHQKEGKKDEDVVVTASRSFLASRTRKDAFPVFEPFPLAFKGLWIYLG